MASQLVLDANILIRAVLGNKVKKLLMEFSDSVDFFVPDICIEEAQQNLPKIYEKCAARSKFALEKFSEVQHILQVVEKNTYHVHAAEAKERIKNRDINDWPVVATALALNGPVWTEDQDFFGSGISVWTTDRIHLFFNKK